MYNIEWQRFPLADQEATVHRWLTFQANRGLAPNTVMAYGRALEDYLRFCQRTNHTLRQATSETIALYLRSCTQPETAMQTPLSQATLKQRLTAIRLYYDYLVEEGVRERNPVGRGQFVPGHPAAGQRGFIPSHPQLPWIPTEAEWQSLVEGMRTESIRNRFMFALSYDTALRRGELCLLEVNDIDPAYRQVYVRAKHSKNHRARTVQYSETTGLLYQAYLQERRKLSRARGPLFLSLSRRNQASPVTIWTWSKVIRSLAQRTELDGFTPHTLRHLRLTDLARAGWELHLIAQFAGHRSLQTTTQYIHLSGRDIAQQLQRGMDDIHRWRMEILQSGWL
ncbi:MAG: tyrosine-type recombinase/integrase [Bacteroidetes bacterium]|nr:MAG: tyrosine-type recombinase/integrase [Bacteroidota bacterium]